jgi:death on curing protein
MFIPDKVIELHDEVLRVYGGASGIRDTGLLDSALNRPFQTFGGEELYPSPYEKATAILESIILNHPFIDGNKRTGFLLAATFLLENNIELTASEDERYNFIIKISTGVFRFDEIINWL